MKPEVLIVVLVDEANPDAVAEKVKQTGAEVVRVINTFKTLIVRVTSDEQRDAVKGLPEVMSSEKEREVHI